MAVSTVTQKPFEKSFSLHGKPGGIWSKGIHLNLKRAASEEPTTNAMTNVKNERHVPSRFHLCYRGTGTKMSGH